MHRLAGQRALVSGGGIGIGLACAQALTQSGAEVTVLGRREAQGRPQSPEGEPARGIHGSALPISGGHV